MRQTKECTGCGTKKALSDFHPDPRLKSGLSNRCKVCFNAICQKSKAKNPKRVRETNARYLEKLKAQRRARGLKRRENGEGPCPEKKRRANRDYKERHKERLRGKYAKQDAAYKKRHRTRYNAHERARQLRQERATLPGHEKYIKMVYEMAIDFGLTVDHEVPLKGKSVSGLHVPWNLRLMSRSANSAKGNRFAA